MDEDIKPGDVVLLTGYYDEYVRQKTPLLPVVLTNRMAKVEEIIDWNSDKGKLIKESRLKSEKWKDLPIEENKYLLSIYYPELTGRRGQKGVVERGKPMFQFHPQTKMPFFRKMPDWMYQEVMKKCETFSVERRTDVPG